MSRFHHRAAEPYPTRHHEIPKSSILSPVARSIRMANEVTGVTTTDYFPFATISSDNIPTFVEENPPDSSSLLSDLFVDTKEFDR